MRPWPTADGRSPLDEPRSPSAPVFWALAATRGTLNIRPGGLPGCVSICVHARAGPRVTAPTSGRTREAEEGTGGPRRGGALEPAEIERPTDSQPKGPCPTSGARKVRRGPGRRRAGAPPRPRGRRRIARPSRTAPKASRLAKRRTLWARREGRPVVPWRRCGVGREDPCPRCLPI